LLSIADLIALTTSGVTPLPENLNKMILFKVF